MRTSLARLAGFATATFAVTAFGQTTLTSADTNPASDNMARTTATSSPSTNNSLNTYAEAGRANMNHFSFGHEVVGFWNAQTTMWTSPTATPQTNNAKANFLPTPGMGGRFITQTFESETGEQDFFGNAWFGFNNTTERYEFAWIDNTSTNILFSYGTRHEDGSINFTGNFADPVTGEKKTTKSKFSWPEKGKMTFEMWSTNSDGSEFKSLEVKYTKAAWPANTPNPAAKDAAPKSGNVNFTAPATTTTTTTPSTSKTPSTTPATTPTHTPANPE